LPALFSVTLFLSAALLFVLQPMVGKMILPLLGGTPAVWNTCMVFFQALLLAGYGYAHLTTGWLGVRRQAVVHLGLLLLPLLFFPIGVATGWLPRADVNPIPWVLGLLFVTAGVPFFVVSTSAPLLQRWFAGTGHPSARDPYFLYAASNLGSMLALLAYPALLEPSLRLADQSLLWAAGYGLLIVLTAVCAFRVWGASGPARLAGPTAPHDAVTRAARSVAAAWSDDLRPGHWWYWVALAFVPSSLLLGVTTYLTTDIAAVPLLWVVPLAIYLLSFILVFARRTLLPPALLNLLTLLAIVGVLFLLFSHLAHFLGAVPAILMHLGLLFLVSMACHGELARRRPAPRHLTAYYLAMSLGGVLGGLFNALVAPLVFRSLIEYPLTLVAACLLLPGSHGGSRARHVLDLALPLLVGGVALLLFQFAGGRVSASLLPFILGLPALFCLPFIGRPVRLGLGLGAVLLAAQLGSPGEGELLHRERSFFGLLEVRYDPTRTLVRLVHGTTLHGQQWLDPSLRREPLMYYHHTGPVGQLFAAFSGKEAPRRVAVTGLGTGTLASYAEDGQEWTFYEIDPGVIRLAEDPRYFTYLSDARDRGARLTMVPGDARLQLADAPDGTYDLIVLDAFSSDAIPVHLLTREALALYLRKLAPEGILAFNITNRYLRLEPVLRALAADAELTALAQSDTHLEGSPGKAASAWVVLARRPETLSRVAADNRWKPASEEAGRAVWTDDFSNLLGVFFTGR
jgi:hypothetical protein